MKDRFLLVLVVLALPVLGALGWLVGTRSGQSPQPAWSEPASAEPVEVVLAATTTSGRSAVAPVEPISSPARPDAAQSLPLDPRFAVSGRVVDERGSPVKDASFWLTVDDGSAETFRTASDGSFRIEHATGRTVQVHAHDRDLYPRWDPEIADVPFGTQGLVIRKLPEPERVPLQMLVVDALTREPIHGATARLLLRDGDRCRGRYAGTSTRGRLAITVPAVENLELNVRSPGRRDVRRLVFGGEEATSTAGREIVVAMESGFRRELNVYDCGLQAPIANARVLHAGDLIAVTDVGGRAWVDLPEWPERLDVEAAGFDAGQWTGQQHLEVNDDVALCPLD